MSRLDCRRRWPRYAPRPRERHRPARRAPHLLLPHIHHHRLRRRTPHIIRHRTRHLDRSRPQAQRMQFHEGALHHELSRIRRKRVPQRPSRRTHPMRPHHRSLSRRNQRRIRHALQRRPCHHRAHADRTILPIDLCGDRSRLPSRLPRHTARQHHQHQETPITLSHGIIPLHHD